MGGAGTVFAGVNIATTLIRSLIILARSTFVEPKTGAFVSLEACVHAWMRVNATENVFGHKTHVTSGVSDDFERAVT